MEAQLIKVAVGIIQHENTILVAQRPHDKPYSGYWEFPGGKIEPYETSEAALKRELHEELGIEVISTKFWFQHPHFYPDKAVLLDIWRMISFNGELYGRENQILRWVTYPELLSLRLLEGNKGILKHFEQDANAIANNIRLFY
ncbi:MAG: hypothetical protein A3F11_07915 [Gammaproteobacteria bacterium RIFCSPHIGHO2_12_FULL_37_14]|nr:MAG: hypothetical protein A3F11_07915 [Gammaproteobacteria bacterium RIFCSPHIGHO2_12_FULL_37_14]